MQQIVTLRIQLIQIHVGLMLYTKLVTRKVWCFSSNANVTKENNKERIWTCFWYLPLFLWLLKILIQEPVLLPKNIRSLYFPLMKREFLFFANIIFIANHVWDSTMILTSCNFFFSLTLDLVHLIQSGLDKAI